MGGECELWVRSLGQGWSVKGVVVEKVGLVRSESSVAIKDPTCGGCRTQGAPRHDLEPFGRVLSLLFQVKLVLEKHVRVHGETAAGAEQVNHGFTLLEQSVDDGRALVDHGGLYEVTQEGEDGLHLSPLRHRLRLVEHPLGEFREEAKVDDDGGSE